MKHSTRVFSFLMSVVVLFASCSSSTMIITNPPNAKLYVDGEMVGQTPYLHRDSKIVGSTTDLRIEKEGYQTLHRDLTKDEEVNIGAIIGGLFVVVPYLWTLKYKPTHNYELRPIAAEKDTVSTANKTQNTQKSKAERLRELKQLLDEKIITIEEFEKEKAKILEMNE